MLRARFRRFAASALLLLGLALVVAACGGGGDDEGASAVNERVSDGQVDSGDEVIDSELSVELETPEFDPATLEDVGLGFLPEQEEACVASRIEAGASVELVTTINGCVSAGSVEQLLAEEGLELSPTEALCVFDSRVEHELQALESETAIEAVDLRRDLHANTVGCMTQDTIDDRIVDVYPDIEFSPDEARCALQIEWMEDEEVFGQTAFCGVAGRVLASEGLAITADGVACIDELGQAALAQFPDELPTLVEDCASEDDLEAITAEFG